MGAQRTSNKDILEAINAQTDSINALVNALTAQTAAPSEPAAPAVTPEPDTSGDPIRVDKSYRDHMVRKVTALTQADGEPRVLYARRNGKGEIKLAFRKQSMWNSLRDRGFVAALEIIDA